jgi:hypothetical protein
MDESEYITATNLAKLRIADSILRDLYFDEVVTQERKASLIARIVEMIEETEGVLNGIE